MAKKVTRLHFTEDDLKDSKVRRAAKKAEKAADKADRAIEKLPKKRKLRAESQGAVSRKKKFRGEKIESGKPSRAKRIAAHAPVTAASGRIHHEVSKGEDENVGVEAAHKGEEAVETGARTASYVKYSGKMRAYKKADKLEKKSDKANIDALWQKQKAEHPQTSTNPLSRWRQKQEIKKQRKQSIRRLLRIPFPGGGRSRKSKNSMQLQRQEKPGQEARLPGTKEYRERARLRKGQEIS